MNQLDLFSLPILDPQVFFTLALVFFFMVLLRYGAVVGLLFYLCWLRPVPRIKGRQIHRRLPGRSQWLMEIKWSLVTTALFAVMGVYMLHLWQVGQTAIYLEWQEYGTLYAVFSFLAYALIHETYFYWMHRLIHHPALFSRMHRIHHLSVRPSPWAAFSFNPSEAILEALIVPVLLLVIPMHPYVLVAYLTFMTLSSVVNHLGFELYPKGTAQHWLGKWLIGATHHSQHHRFSTCNYGLYFTFWDRWCGTHHPGFERAFAEITANPLYTFNQSLPPKSVPHPDNLPGTKKPRPQS